MEDTKEGLDFVASHPEPFSSQTSTQLAMGFIGVRLKPEPTNGDKAEQEQAVPSLISSTVASLMIDLVRPFARSDRQQNQSYLSFSEMYLLHSSSP